MWWTKIEPSTVDRPSDEQSQFLRVFTKLWANLYDTIQDIKNQAKFFTFGVRDLCLNPSSNTYQLCDLQQLISQYLGFFSVKYEY